MRGILEAEDVRDRIARLKTEKEGLQQEICRLEHSKSPIALHPTAITAYLASVENLEDSIRTNSLAASEDSKSALRELVEAVIVGPPETNEIGMKIEVRGYLSKLMGADLFPQRSYQGGKVSAPSGALGAANCPYCIRIGGARESSLRVETPRSYEPAGLRTTRRALVAEEGFEPPTRGL